MSPTHAGGPGSETRRDAATLGKPLRIVALSVLSVPFLHLYLRVDLSPLELLIHALDIGLAAALACALSRVASAMLLQNATIRARARRMQSIGVALLSLALFFFAFQGLLPGSDAIHERHVRAGYGDMGLRVVPLAGLLGYLAWAAERRSRLRREVTELRAVNARIAQADTPAVLSEDAPLALVHGGGVLLAPPSEVMRVEAMENYCEFVLRPEAGQGSLRRVLVRMTLAEARKRLPPERFVQPHRSHLVQLGCIRAVVRDARATCLDLGIAGRVPVSRTQRSEILTRIGRHSSTPPLSPPPPQP